MQRGTDSTSSVRLRRDKRKDEAAAANAVAAAAVAAQRKSNRHSGDFLLWSNHKVGAHDILNTVTPLGHFVTVSNLQCVS